MRILNFTICVVYFAVSHCAAETVRGHVRLLTEPSPTEYAEAYEKSSEPLIGKVKQAVKARQRENGIDDVLVPLNAVVELQTLPNFKVVAKANVDKDGCYCMEAKEDNRDWRVYCKCELEEFGKKVTFVASSHVKWSKRDNAYVQNLYLRRDFVSLFGRCFEKNGLPAVNAVVRIELRTTPDEVGSENNRSYVARTDEDGFWRSDGIDAPAYEKMISYLINTNVFNIYDSSLPPYQISIRVQRKYFAESEDEVVVPNVCADSRLAVEKYLAAYERKTGKKHLLLHPLRNFPVSTNNVIYIPDMTMK